MLPRLALPAATAAAGPARLLVAASPYASSFHRAGGLKGLVPSVYTSLERELTAAAAARRAPLRLAHYRREGWTFHAKGLWLWPPGPTTTPLSLAAPQRAAARPAHPAHPADAPAEAVGRGDDDAARPVLSLLGSSNLGHRSVHLDLELGACLVSTDEAVRSLLQHEQARLREHTEERAPPGEARAAAEEEEEARVPLVARCAGQMLRQYF